jgi:hypothetical protein
MQQQHCHGHTNQIRTTNDNSILSFNVNTVSIVDAVKEFDAPLGSAGDMKWDGGKVFPV